MKKIVALLIGIFSLFVGVFSGCKTTKTTGDFSITDIVWEIQEKSFEGKNTVVFSYKNII